MEGTGEGSAGEWADEERHVGWKGNVVCMRRMCLGEEKVVGKMQDASQASWRWHDVAQSSFDREPIGAPRCSGGSEHTGNLIRSTP